MALEDAKENETPREAFLRGRLLGLNDLVEVLKDSLDKSGGENEAVVKDIVEHVTNEIEDLLSELKETANKHEAKKIEAIEEKHEELKQGLKEESRKKAEVKDEGKTEGEKEEKEKDGKTKEKENEKGDVKEES